MNFVDEEAMFNYQLLMARGICLLQTGCYGLSTIMFRECLEIAENFLSDNEIMQSLLSLAESFWQQDRFDEGELAWIRADLISERLPVTGI